VPKHDGRNRDAHFVLYWFRRDCEVLGLRQRRQYDSRRTFVSLAQADGARKDILRWISHGPEGDIVSLYTTLPWQALCEEVAKLKIGLRSGRLIELPKVANASGTDATFTTALTTDTARQSKTLSITRLWNDAESVPDGIRTPFRQLKQTCDGARLFAVSLCRIGSWIESACPHESSPESDTGPEFWRHTGDRSCGIQCQSIAASICGGTGPTRTTV